MNWLSIGAETHPWANTYRDYESALVPDIAGCDIASILDVATAARVGAAQEAMRSFDQHMTDEFGPLELGTIATVLMRSEASSSSQIEHLTVSSKQLALAEIGESKSVNAKLVRGNVAAMEAATTQEGFTTSAVTQMQRDVLGDTGLHLGVRDEQVWIGTSGSTPIGADFVPPHHNHVPHNLDDLWRFLDAPAALPLAQIAVGHAQFETIHPFVDGNGRVGRVLIHCYLRQSKITSHLTVPISAGLLASPPTYVEALTAYRHGNPVPIVEEFARASQDAASIGHELITDLRLIRDGWNSRITARRDSAAWRIADTLIGQPALTADLAAVRAGVSVVAARHAITSLVEAGILKRASTGKRNQVWVAEEVTSCYDRIAVLIGRRKAY